mgnify:FL=1|jgi:hypothetical protein
MKILIIASILIFSVGCSSTSKSSKYHQSMENKAEKISVKYDRF